MNICIPTSAKYILQKLQSNGFECFAVGGCVRDSLSGHNVHDWDFTTNATPNEIISCFPKYTTIDIGKRYGTIGVVINGENFEITTYRSDGAYNDSRHPSEVSFSKSLHDDLSRRDFTINALAYNDTTGLVDEFGGAEDLKNGVIRAINNPCLRFKEDALRILRALRFASVFGYTIEPDTQKAIFDNKDTLLSISSERISAELTKLLCGKNVEYVLNRYRDVFAVFIPELKPLFDFDQHTPHHNLDVYSHTARAVSNINPDEISRLTMLFHDIAKPQSCITDSNGRCHFKGHPLKSAAISEPVLKRLRLPKSTVNTVCLLIKYHDERITPDTQTVKRYMRDLGAQNLSLLFKVQQADIMAQSDYHRKEKLDTLDAVITEYNRILSSGECYSLNMLNISGNDILNRYNIDGKAVGLVLNTLLDMVIQGNVDNTKNSLLSYADTIIRSQSLLH